MFSSSISTRNSSNDSYFSWKTPFTRISMVLVSCPYEHQLGEVSTSDHSIAFVHIIAIVTPLIMHYKSNTACYNHSHPTTRPSQIQSTQHSEDARTMIQKTNTKILHIYTSSTFAPLLHAQQIYFWPRLSKLICSYLFSDICAQNIILTLISDPNFVI